MREKYSFLLIIFIPKENSFKSIKTYLFQKGIESVFLFYFELK